MRSQRCRDAIDWVKVNCNDLSPDAIREVKLAGKFVKDRAPYLEKESTASVNKIRTIKDPIVQGEVLKHIKIALETDTDPRTGDRLHHGAGKITTPMIKWLIQWVETGTKPPYVKRGSAASRTREKLSSDEVEVLSYMRDRGIQCAISKSDPDMVMKIKRIYNKLVGEFDAS